METIKSLLEHRRLCSDEVRAYLRDRQRRFLEAEEAMVRWKEEFWPYSRAEERDAWAAIQQDLNL